MRRLFRFSVRHRREVDRDVRSEIEFHLDMRAQDLVEAGWSPDAADAEARRQFGDIGLTERYCRRVNQRTETRMTVRQAFGELTQDVAYATRTIVRQPALTLLAIATTALGIGAVVFVFAVVHAVLIAPLPYAAPDRLAVMRVSLPDYDDIHRAVPSFEQSGVWASNLYMMDDEQVLGGVMSPSVFTTLGVPPLLGRAISETDRAAPVIVLSHALWLSRFGGDPHVLGRTVRLNGIGHTVIGVMPARFAFPSSAFRLWTGLDFALSQVPGQRENRALRIFQSVVRLAPGTTLARARAELTPLAARLARIHPDTNTGVAFELVSLRERRIGPVRTTLLVVMAAVGGLLLIACANVASLTLSRVTARVHEFAVRAALGAGRWRLGRQLVTESLLLSIVGGLLGLLLAYWALALVPLLADRVPGIEDATLSVPVLFTAIAVVLGTGVLVSVGPILHVRSAPLEPALRGSGRAGDAPQVGRLRAALVVTQVALAAGVLAGGVLLTHSLLRLLDVNLGPRPDRLLTFTLPLVQETTPGARVLKAAAVLERLRGVRGVEEVGAATGLAPITAQRGTTFEVEGRGDVPPDDRNAYFIAASPGFFDTLGTRMVTGREFTSADAPAAPPVCIVSAALAARLFPGGDAVGRRIRLINPDYPDDWRTIVGVAHDIPYQGLEDRTRPVLYTPFSQTPFLWSYVYVRTTTDPLQLLPSIRAVVKSVDARLSVGSPRPMTALIAEASADPRVAAFTIGTFAVAALVLAATGLYAMLSFAVAQGRREIAIQRALGAPAATITWQVVRRALVLTAAGLGIGLVGMAWLGRWLTTVLFEVTPADPLTIAIVTMTLLLIAVLAAAGPARRAMRVDPLRILRES